MQLLPTHGNQRRGFCIKKIVFLSLIVLLSMCTYAQEKKSPPEGAWKCVNMGGSITTNTSFRAIIKEGQIKMFS